jgi:hypothetical protein
MRSAIRIVLLGLLVTAVAGIPASAHPRWWSPPAPQIQAKAWASTARQGGTLLVTVQVRIPRSLARRGVAPVATATVHFASAGDVSVDITGRAARAGRGHRFGGHAWWSPARIWRGVVRVPVAADEQVGRVPVDLTITLGDGSVTITAYGRIRKARGAPTPPPTDPDPTTPCTAGCNEL